jgi:TRAP-type C4-dicarboxylate transport system substrate-binding protein
MSFISQANFCKAAVVCAAVLMAPPTADAREFRVADTQSEDYPTVQALHFMSRLVEERTGGRHRIRVFHSRQLGEEKDTIEQTRVGAIDLNRTNVAPIGSLIPAANVLALPFLFRSFGHLHKVLDQAIGDEILAGSQRHGFVGLTFYDSGARSIYNSVRQVRSLADMKGLRIRVQQSELMFEMIKALGAEPIELPYGQVSRALDQADRWRGEQLAVLRYDRPLQARSPLHPDRAHDGTRGTCHVAPRVGKPVGRG